MTGEIDLFFIDTNETNPYEKSLAHVVSATFEKMGFMEAFETKDRAEDTNMLCATLFINKPVEANMYFSCPQSLSWKIAENLYGLEELSSEVVNDMLTELLNTIAGSWLSEIIPNQKFSLSIPQICTDTDSDNKNRYEYYFNIENVGIITIGLKRV